MNKLFVKFILWPTIRLLCISVLSAVNNIPTIHTPYFPSRLASRLTAHAGARGVPDGIRYPQGQVARLFDAGNPAYRLFKDETGEDPDEKWKTREFLAKLPDRVRRDLKKQLLAAISEDIDETLKP